MHAGPAPSSHPIHAHQDGPVSLPFGQVGITLSRTKAIPSSISCGSAIELIDAAEERSRRLGHAVDEDHLEAVDVDHLPVDRAADGALALITLDEGQPLRHWDRRPPGRKGKLLTDWIWVLFDDTGAEWHSDAVLYLTAGGTQNGAVHVPGRLNL